MPRLAGGPGDRDAAARGVGVGPAGAGAHLLLFRPADAPEAAGEDADAAYLNKGSLASTRVYASTLRDRADAHRRAFRTVAVSLPSPPASWRWHVGLTHKSCARFAGRWLDAELEARLGAAGAEAEGDALAEARASVADGSRAPARRRARRRADRRGGARGARARARDAAAAERATDALLARLAQAYEASDGVNAETDGAERSAAVALGVVAGACHPGDHERRARAAAALRGLCAPQREPRWGNGKRGDEPDENEPRGAPGGGPRRRRRGARHVRAEPGRLRREGRARRGCVAHRDARGASRVSAARLPRARQDDLRRVRAGPRARRRRRRRVRARRDAARFRNVRFRDPRGSPAARHVASHRVRLGRARARGAHTAPRARRRRDRTRTRRRRGGGGGGGGGGAGGAHRGGGCARRGSPLRRLGVARAPRTPRAVPQMYHQTRAKKTPILASAATCVSRAWPPRARCSTSRSLPASPSRARRRRRLWPPPPRLWRCPGPRRPPPPRRRRSRRRTPRARPTRAMPLAGRLVVPGGRGSRRTPRTRASAAPRERERGAPRRGGTERRADTLTQPLLWGRRLWRRAGVPVRALEAAAPRRARRGRCSVALRARGTARVGPRARRDDRSTRARSAALWTLCEHIAVGYSWLRDGGTARRGNDSPPRRSPLGADEAGRADADAAATDKAAEARPRSRRRARCACSRRSPARGRLGASGWRRIEREEREEANGSVKTPAQTSRTRAPPRVREDRRGERAPATVERRVPARRTSCTIRAAPEAQGAWKSGERCGERGARLRAEAAPFRRSSRCRGAPDASAGAEAAFSA